MTSRSKNSHKIGLKLYLMNSPIPFSVTFWYDDRAFLVREATVVISKEVGGWLIQNRKEKILKNYNFLALTTHALSNRVSEKAFLEKMKIKWNNIYI